MLCISKMDVKLLLKAFEMEEIESSTMSPEVYAKLLALYLHENDICNAKYLWKRIPSNVKSSHPELGLIWKVAQNLWKRDFPNVYASLNANWSEEVAPIMKGVLEMVRKRVVDLVSHAYSSINIADLATLVGMSVDEALIACQQQGWDVDTASNMISPKVPEPTPCRPISSEEQLFKLTEYVTFLEN